MLQFPEIDPIAIAIGPLKIHWYAITYIVGFAAAFFLGRLRADKPDSGWSREDVTDLITNCAMGVILGGRIGYMLFYKFGDLADNPISLFYIWQGGMSFHGGLIGVGIAVWMFARSRGKSVYEVMDFTAPLSPIGLGSGRIGNFINGELWGRQTDVSWGMVFPSDPEALVRHPSQIYQFATEGLLLFILLWLYSSRSRPRFAVTGMFLFGYGIFRTCTEFFREPDAHLQNSLLFDWMTRGQQLSIPMVLAGSLIIYLAYSKNLFQSATKSATKSNNSKNAKTKKRKS